MTIAREVIYYILFIYWLLLLGRLVIELVRNKVATKVFLLAPSDIDVSPEDRRKIAETGFYNHQ